MSFWRKLFDPEHHDKVKKDASLTDAFEFHVSTTNVTAYDVDRNVAFQAEWNLETEYLQPTYILLTYNNRKQQFYAFTLSLLEDYTSGRRDRRKLPKVHKKVIS